jgi:hypothetical protein
MAAKAGAARRCRRWAKGYGPEGMPQGREREMRRSVPPGRHVARSRIRHRSAGAETRGICRTSKPMLHGQANIDDDDVASIVTKIPRRPRAGHRWLDPPNATPDNARARREVRWQSGDATDCKSAYAGSIPARTSNRHLCEPPPGQIGNPPTYRSAADRSAFARRGIRQSTHQSIAARRRTSAAETPADRKSRSAKA